MSRVITFSRVFPSYHPRKGEPTNFVEKIWKGLDKLNLTGEELDRCINDYFVSADELCSYNSIHSKYHTIRAGNRWKVGDKFSPRVWSGKPYASKQIIIAPDIEIKKVWDLEIEVGKEYWFFKLNGEDISNGKEDFNIDEFTETLAKNDGLELSDFLNWFPKSVKAQIICWNENIKY
ncbi:MAG: hypothetical protein V4538_15070 [Bacteroidota bacterium]